MIHEAKRKTSIGCSSIVVGLALVDTRLTSATRIVSASGLATQAHFVRATSKCQVSVIQQVGSIWLVRYSQSSFVESI